MKLRYFEWLAKNPGLASKGIELSSRHFRLRVGSYGAPQKPFLRWLSDLRLTGHVRQLTIYRFAIALLIPPHL